MKTGLRKLVDLSGQRFCRLVVLGPHESRRKKMHWLCKCDCGNEPWVETQSLQFLGYIVKALPYAEFEIALDRVLRGEQTFPKHDFHSQLSMRLTRRQEQLLDLVRCGMSSKEIARTVSLSEGSVSNCINAAMKALEVTSRSHAVAKALELGLLDLHPVRRPSHTI